MPRKSLSVTLSESEVIRLEQWLRAGSTPQQALLRAKIILRASQGQTDQQIAHELKLQRHTAALWPPCAPARNRLRLVYLHKAAKRITGKPRQPVLSKRRFKQNPRERHTGALARWLGSRVLAKIPFIGS